MCVCVTERERGVGRDEGYETHKACDDDHSVAHTLVTVFILYFYILKSKDLNKR